jgi:hypothetical protein
MPQQQLDGAHIGALLQQMYREGVPQRMRRCRFGDAATLMRLLAHALHGAPGDVPARDIAGEEPRPQPGGGPAVGPRRR